MVRRNDLDNSGIAKNGTTNDSRNWSQMLRQQSEAINAVKLACYTFIRRHGQESSKSDGMPGRAGPDEDDGKIALTRRRAIRNEQIWLRP